MSDGSHHKFHLVLHAFVDRQSNKGCPREADFQTRVFITQSTGKLLHQLGLSRCALMRVLPSSNENALPQLVEVFLCRGPLHLRHVFFRHMPARMQKLVSQRTIGGKEDHPCRVSVEPSYMVESRVFVHGQQVGDALPPHLIAHRGIASIRFIQRNDDIIGRQGNTRSIEQDLIAEWIDLYAHLGHNDAVHGYMALCDIALARPTATESRSREKLLQTHYAPLLIAKPRDGSFYSSKSS